MRKLRLLFVVSAFLGLALISALFGALTSIASDLPGLENTVQFSNKVDSYMYDINGNPIGPLAPASTPAIDHWAQISPNMRNAIVAVEDRGFWGESGISVRGLLRAGLADLSGGETQGGSTIPEEFIKNVRSEEGDRTVAEKLVEAGMAFQLSHHWKHRKILTEYLNTIYFGNGALGIEAAARTYFGYAHGYDTSNPAEGGKDACGDADPEHPHRPECASVLTPAQAALLAGIVANPSAFNPAGTQTEQDAALARRNLVLEDMYHQHYISHGLYQYSVNRPLPTPAQIRQPEQQPSTAPYFTSWVEPQVVQALEHQGLAPKEAQYEADYGGLKIKLSIDLNLQRQAQAAVDDELPGRRGPAQRLAGCDLQQDRRGPSDGQRRQRLSAVTVQPGDHGLPATRVLVQALHARGRALQRRDQPLLRVRLPPAHDPVREDKQQPVRRQCVLRGERHGRFPVHNFGNVYSGSIPMTVATAISDNTVFAQLGMDPKVGTAAIAKYAHLMGIRSPVSRNPSMILGGLKTGVSALDMAHAYSTAANGGKKVYNPTLGDGNGPIGIDSISNCSECHQDDTITNIGTMKTRQVITPDVAATIDELLHGPVDDSYGTGTAAAIPGVDVAGKTGTTSNFVDAWFVGWTPNLTVAVWVGYPNSGKPMLTDYNGEPVEGGSYPAVIWRDFVVGAIQIIDEEAANRRSKTTKTDTTLFTPTTYGTANTGTGASTTSHTATTQKSATTGQNGSQTTPSNGATNTPATNTPNQSATVPATITLPPPPHSTGTSTSGGSGL